MVSFGQRLKKLRIDGGLTQAELANKVDAYQSKYRNWETDLHEPDIATINKIADIFGVTADWLLGREDSDKPYPTEIYKEILLLQQEVMKYDIDSIKRLRKMLPLIFESKKK